jgi:hypothetical protein
VTAWFIYIASFSTLLLLASLAIHRIAMTLGNSR